MRFQRSLVSVLIGTFGLASGVMAQPTALSYQGRLMNGTQPASGAHDFRFTLFNVASGGAALSPPVCVDNVVVTGGVFTATVDFGQQFVTTSNLFLQVDVRADTGLACATTTGF